MFEWKLEDLKLYNQKDGVFIGDEKIYDCENTLSKEEKIDFVDKMQDGKLSYVLALADKFADDVDSLPKTQYGNIKDNSFKAWIRKNDSRGVLDNNFEIGRISLCPERNIKTIMNKGDYDLYEEYIDEAFHRQLKKCENEEKWYFLEHGEYSILKKKFREKNQIYNTTFGVNITFCSDGKTCIYEKENRRLQREITIEELKYLLGKYDELENLINKITEETNIVY